MALSNYLPNGGGGTKKKDKYDQEKNSPNICEAKKQENYNIE